MLDFKTREQKWQKYWKDTKAFQTKNDDRKKYYVLDMFPYPSGAGLHIGHTISYTATDVIARYKFLNDFDVLHPMGWDAFGLPSEQYALTTGNHPSTFTQQNIQNFKKQIHELGYIYDWNKEIDTTDPKYYKWTQWIFKVLYKRGLAKIKNIEVNWCDGLKTVLANEEVITDAQGNKVSERGGFPVVRKPMKQWVLEITKYADKLLEGLNEIEFPESLKALQRNWIGKSEGLEIDFAVQNSNEKIKVFTTRPDTIFGATFVVISPKHKLINSLVTPEQKNLYEQFSQFMMTQSERELQINTEKIGVFTGSYAVHPLNDKLLPIWIGNYISDDYGTGAIMAVPAHDERDYEFAKKYESDNNLIILPVIESQNLPNMGDGPHIHSEFLNGLNNEEAIKVISEELIKMKIAQKKTTYKLRDWIFSRQRYWGEPFPVYFDDNGKIYLDKGLVELPELKDFKPAGDGQSPLAKNTEWVNFVKDGKHYHRETNTMPQWAGSSWYYLAYILKQPNGEYLDLDSKEAQELFKKWLPVDLYIGGQEHAVLHLLYARFWHKVLFDAKYVPTSEPFYKLVNQGMILGSDGTKMSKSKGNVINPSTIIEQVGADALRTYVMFMSPLNETKIWNDQGVNGIKKWLDRVYVLIERLNTNLLTIDPHADNKEIESLWNQTIVKVTENIESLKFNIAISQLMVFVNGLYKVSTIPSKQVIIDLVIMLSLFAPHLAEQMLSELNEKQIPESSWPQADLSKIIEDKITYAVQINGKLRGTLEVNTNVEKEEIINQAKEVENVKTHLSGQEIKKVIFVENKIVNFIV